MQASLVLSTRVEAIRLRIGRSRVSETVLDQAIDLAEELYLQGHSVIAANLLKLGEVNYYKVPRLELRYENAMGNLFGDLGAWERSFSHLQKSLSLANVSGNKRAGLTALVSLTGNAVLSGQYKLTADNIKRAETFPQNVVAIHQSTLRSNEAMMHSYSGGDLRQGLRAIKAARRYLEEVDPDIPSYRHRTTLVDTVEARLRINLKDFDRAYEIASNAYARHVKEHSAAAAWANLSFGLAHVAIGNALEGSHYLGKALQMTAGLGGAQDCVRENLLLANVLAHQYERALIELSSFLNDTVSVGPRQCRRPLSSSCLGVQDRSMALSRLAHHIASETLIGRRRRHQQGDSRSG